MGDSSVTARHKTIPDNKICLRLILVSGRTHEFIFAPNDTVNHITRHVYENWPEDWKEEAVSSHNILKLIYHGRFLHGNVSLAALSLETGKRSVMHLVARENLPEPATQDDDKEGDQAFMLPPLPQLLDSVTDTKSNKT